MFIYDQPKHLQVKKRVARIKSHSIRHKKAACFRNNLSNKRTERDSSVNVVSRKLRRNKARHFYFSRIQLLTLHKISMGYSVCNSHFYDTTCGQYRMNFTSANKIYI